MSSRVSTACGGNCETVTVSRSVVACAGAKSAPVSAGTAADAEAAGALAVVSRAGVADCVAGAGALVEAHPVTNATSKTAIVATRLRHHHGT